MIAPKCCVFVSFLRQSLAEPKAFGLRAPQRGLKKPGVREIAAGLKDEYRKGIQKKTEDARKTPPGLTQKHNNRTRPKSVAIEDLSIQLFTARLDACSRFIKMLPAPDRPLFQFIS